MKRDDRDPIWTFTLRAWSIVSLASRDPVASVFAVACTCETSCAPRMRCNRTWSEGFIVISVRYFRHVRKTVLGRAGGGGRGLSVRRQ
jgi:hypothetical protein